MVKAKSGGRDAALDVTVVNVRLADTDTHWHLDIYDFKLVFSLMFQYASGSTLYAFKSPTRSVVGRAEFFY